MERLLRQARGCLGLNGQCRVANLKRLLTYLDLSASGPKAELMSTRIITPIPFVHIWISLRTVHPCLRNPWLMRPKAKMKALFVFIASMVMHPRAMISSFVKVHIPPQLDGTSCA